MKNTGEKVIYGEPSPLCKTKQNKTLDKDWKEQSKTLKIIILDCRTITVFIIIVVIEIRVVIMIVVTFV